MKALLVLAMLSTLATSVYGQEARIQIEGEGDESVWTIADPKNIRLIDLLQAYSKSRGISVVFDERRFGGSDISVTSTNLRLQGEQIDMLVANSLETVRMAIFSRGAGQYAVQPLAEAVNFAPTMNEKEFESAKPWQWCTVVLTIEHAHANDIRVAVQNLVSRQGGAVLPGRNSVTLTERADRQKELAKAIREMDASAATEVKGYDLPEGADANSTLKTLTALFGTDIANRELTISLQEGTSRILVRARPVRHVEVAQAVAALK